MSLLLVRWSRAAVGIRGKVGRSGVGVSADRAQSIHPAAGVRDPARYSGASEIGECALRFADEPPGTAPGGENGVAPYLRPIAHDPDPRCAPSRSSPPCSSGSPRSPPPPSTPT